MPYPFYQQPNQYNALYTPPQMAYSTPQIGYPSNYTNPQQNAPQNDADSRIWVQGEGGANSYLVAPNSFVRLWDSQASVFYEKRADASGRPTTEVYEYKKRGEVVPMNNETSTLETQLKELEKRIATLEQRGANNVKSNVKSITDDTEL